MLADFRSSEWYAPLADLHEARLVEVDGLALVGFFEDADKRQAGRRTHMRVGRYVRRFSRLTDEEVERLAAAADVKLRGNLVRFTQDPDEIETIYLNGPRSCMKPGGPGHHFTQGPIATRVFAGPDLALAFLGDLSAPTARAVCWPEKKLHAPVYGDTSRLALMLEQMGYRRGPFVGARVRLIETKQGDWLLPSLDDQLGVDRIDREAGLCILGSIGGRRGVVSFDAKF